MSVNLRRSARLFSKINSSFNSLKTDEPDLETKKQKETSNSKYWQSVEYREKAKEHGRLYYRRKLEENSEYFEQKHNCRSDPKVERQKKRLNCKYKQNAEFREKVKEKARLYYWKKMQEDSEYFKKKYNDKRREYMRKRLSDPNYRQIHYQRVREYQERKNGQNKKEDEQDDDIRVEIENVEADYVKCESSNEPLLATHQYSPKHYVIDDCVPSNMTVDDDFIEIKLKIEFDQFDD